MSGERYCVVEDCTNLVQGYAVFDHGFEPLQSGEAIGQMVTVVFQVPLCDYHGALMDEFRRDYPRPEWSISHDL
ncbi:MAG TPA: hypothetical protein VKU38_03685 [Ktedonobacteraceae bacterium]|nr:hypothetical protein [Ktedonobacteraceae bacterium]